MSPLELSTTGSREDQQLIELVDEITACLQSGQQLDIDDYLTRYPEYADRLQSWLQAMTAMADLGNSLALHKDADDSASTATDAEGQVTGLLGDYRILGELGRGGMGVVYEAEQISIGRRVALKVLPFAAMLDKQQLNRFKNEARAAGTLDHPNIVAVYSVGTERGVHYYAMQLIEGQSLAEVIGALRIADRGSRIEEEANAASGSQSEIPNPISAIETRRDVQAAISSVPKFDTQEYFRTVAQLGIQAAQALDHAHQNGIVHRDVKPSNLLVDGDGKLWVTDFGLARIEADAGMTMTGDLLGTLRYMSPEQASGGRTVLDHRTDIYSLGATLYELLTLKPVFSGEDRQELLNQIDLEEPRPPRRFHPALPADLETIVLKAIRKNPADRYTTAQQLANDLECFLADRPIQARRPTVWQHLARWSRRHRAAVWSAVAVLVLAVVGLAVAAGLIWSEQRRTASALAESKQKAAETDAVVKFLVNDLLGSAAPEKTLGRQITVEEVLAEAEQKIDTAFADQPVVEAAIRHTLGLTYYKLGKNKPAERHLTRAAELRTSHLSAEHVDTLSSMYNLARVFWGQGNYDESRKLHEETLDVQRRVLGPEHQDTLRSMNYLGDAIWHQGNYAEAGKLFEKTLDVQRRVLGPEHKDTLSSMFNLAYVFSNQGNYVEARKLHEETLEIKRRVLGPEHPDTLASMSSLANVLWNLGKYAEARELFEETLEMMRRVLGPEHPDTLFSMANLASVFREQGKFAEAQELYEEALERKLRVLGPEHPSTLRAMDGVPGTLRDQARSLMVGAVSSSSDVLRALELANRAAELRPHWFSTWLIIGWAHYRSGDWQASIDSLEKSIELQDNSGDSWQWFFLAMAHWQLGEEVEARRWYDMSVEWMEINEPNNEELRRFRAEAAELLGIEIGDEGEGNDE